MLVSTNRQNYKSSGQKRYKRRIERKTCVYVALIETSGKIPRGKMAWRFSHAQRGGVDAKVVFCLAQHRADQNAKTHFKHTTKHTYGLAYTEG